jgi:transposase-like protein
MPSEPTSRSLWRAVQKARWTADDARRVLAAWRASGERAGRFARRHGLNSQRLTWWRDRLGEWETTSASGASFVPVVRTEAGAPVRVRLPGGATVEIDSEAVEATWVASLLRGLASPSEK